MDKIKRKYKGNLYIAPGTMFSRRCVEQCLIHTGARFNKGVLSLKLGASFFISAFSILEFCGEIKLYPYGTGIGQPGNK